MSFKNYLKKIIQLPCEVEESEKNKYLYKIKLFASLVNDGNLQKCICKRLNAAKHVKSYSLWVYDTDLLHKYCLVEME